MSDREPFLGLGAKVATASTQFRVVERTGYWMSFWRARWGWYGEWTDYGAGDRIGTGSETMWRPSEAWVRCVIARQVARERRRDQRRDEAQTVAA